MKYLLIIIAVATATFTLLNLIFPIAMPRESSYQLYIDQSHERYILKEGDRVVWTGSFNSQIDSLVLSDNL